jgi:hypothetical protein
VPHEERRAGPPGFYHRRLDSTRREISKMTKQAVPYARNAVPHILSEMEGPGAVDSDNGGGEATPAQLKVNERKGE